MTCVLIRSRKFGHKDKDTQEAHHGKMEVEPGVMLPQTKQCLGLQETERDKEGSPPKRLWREWALPTP